MSLESSDQAGLAEACRRWQGGRDGGSSLLRGAARVLTGVPHYFTADFIQGYEDQARADSTALDDARALLEALDQAEALPAPGWVAHLELDATDPFAGRGLKPKPEDDQIRQRLAGGTIDMPLWGVSLDRRIAEDYGTEFLFELVGPFPAVPAWTYSGIKPEECELITGGRYSVEPLQIQDGTTLVKLRWTAALTVPSGLIGSADHREG